jgi:hypothetical protein
MAGRDLSLERAAARLFARGADVLRSRLDSQPRPHQAPAETSVSAPAGSPAADAQTGTI